MLSSFWGTIAIEAVQDMVTRPQTTQLMADLLGMTVSQFLILTQSYTLPWLVLSEKPEVIKRISEARKDKEIWVACMETSNRVAILPLLLIQNVTDTEIFVMKRFRGISSQFKDLEFTDLLRCEPASQALNLLKMAGDAGDDKKSRVRLEVSIFQNSI